MAMPFGPFLQSITPRGLLSFGPDTAPLELRPLNVLIGPNGSGKSNLIDVVGLVRSLPSDVRSIRYRGKEWAWNGISESDSSLEVAVRDGSKIIRHQVSFFDLVLVAEEIADDSGVLLYQRQPWSNPSYLRRDGEMQTFDIPDEFQSVLSQVKSAIDYPDITSIASIYSSIRQYTEWQFGREILIRQPQTTDTRGDILAEDYSNLILFLNQLGAAPRYKRKIIEGLRELYPRFTDYEVVVTGGLAQLFFTEGDMSIPATRLSDGTLRYLCLLAILYNPKPPPLVCLEEPELGLHPDIVAGLAKHLLAASERMQLVVTTHSDILIDALSDTPESIVVFENEDGATRMKRLDADELKVWLEDYRLGQLWTSGQIGGVRW